MSPRTRKMLDQIDTFLARPATAEPGELWDVLTALRGPDSDNEMVKEYTTCPIRRAAFPKLVSLDIDDFAPGPSCRRPGMGTMEEGYQKQDNYSHFGIHANGAARVLGLLLFL